MRNTFGRVVMVCTAFAACACTTTSQQATTRPVAADGGVTIRGTARLRAGAAAPAGAALHVIVRSGAGYIYGEYAGPPGQWPVPFSVRILDWPQGKGAPIMLNVMARGEADGRVVLVAEGDTPVSFDGAMAGRPVEVVLRPAIE
jgi:hypothetical protein